MATSISESLGQIMTLEDYLLKILQEGPMTRDELSRITFIPRTTLYDTLIRLIRQGYVLRFKKPHGIGRSNVYFILRKQVPFYNRNHNYVFY